MTPSSWRRLSLQVFQRDLFTCQGCTAVLPPPWELAKAVLETGLGYLVADHIVPRQDGGASTLENLQTLCASCNSAKAGRPAAYLKVRTVVRAMTPVLIYPALIHMVGLKEAVFLSRLLYWSARSKDNGWVYKTAEEWEEETSLSYREQRRVREALSGLVQEHYDRVRHRLYYRPVFDAVAALTEAFRAEDSAADPVQDIDSEAGPEWAHDETSSAGGAHNETSGRDVTNRHVAHDETSGRRSNSLQKLQQEDTTSNLTLPGLPPPTPHGNGNGHVRRTEKPTEAALAAEWAAFYKAFPRKTAPDAGRRAYVAARRKGVSRAALWDGLQRALPELRLRPPDRIPYPASWINAGEWKNEEAPVGAGVAGVAPGDDGDDFYRRFPRY